MRFLLNALAYNLMSPMRTVVVAVTGEPCSLGRLRDRLLGVAARVVVHARRVTVVVTDAASRWWNAAVLGLQRVAVVPT